MGNCQYRFTATELYQRTKPGMGVETICGGRTYPAADEPELAAVTEYHDGQPVTAMHPTGRFLPRAQDDPHCPAHGGSPEPPPPPVPLAQLEAAFTRYQALAAQYAAQEGGALSAPVTAPAALPAGQQEGYSQSLAAAAAEYEASLRAAQEGGPANAG